MRVLLATCRSDDYVATCLWDGLRTVCGASNVVDAAGNHGFHLVGEFGWNTRVAGAGNPTEPLILADEKDFDVLVLNASLLRDHDWQWAFGLLSRLRKGGKVAWVEGWDSADEYHVPPFHVDGVFRREMYSGVRYPYPVPCHPLLMAAPERWFEPEPGHRPFDVFCVNWHWSHPLRWEVLQHVFRTPSRHVSVTASGGVPNDEYLSLLRRSKVCVVTPGAGYCSDGARQWEAIALGTIPIFVGHPDRVRDPWFTDEIFWCSSSAELPGQIEHAIHHADLPAIRDRLRRTALEHHTTRARALRLLTLIGAIP